jgi:3-deoxy-D-manno-octulosonate 8-phosphate phosphatase (KDO 8-P phosphatase)
MVSLKRIKLLVFDIDGVLTDGRLYFLPDGTEMKVFSVHDGVGILLAREAGLKIVFLTGRGGKAVENRAKELKVHKLMTSVKAKEKVLPRVMKEMGCSRDETLFMTDEVLDLNAMDLAGVTACPADASPEVLEKARIIASRPGGMGAVREVIEKVLKTQGKWLTS